MNDDRHVLLQWRTRAVRDRNMGDRQVGGRRAGSKREFQDQGRSDAQRAFGHSTFLPG
jgi:hypothetical protein